MIKRQNISSGEKTRKLDTLGKLFQAMRRQHEVATIGQLTKVRIARMLKNCADELWKLARANSLALSYSEVRTKPNV